jgi:uncharacterized OB-fold protein
MKKCKNCYNETFDEDGFCPYCGTEFSETENHNNVKKTNVFAIVAFVLSFFFLTSFFAIILGVVGLIQSQETHCGKKLAIASIIISIVSSIIEPFIIVFVCSIL